MLCFPILTLARIAPPPLQDIFVAGPSSFPVSASCASRANCTAVLQQALAQCAAAARRRACTVQLDARAVYPLEASPNYRKTSVLLALDAHAASYPVTLDGAGSELRLQPLAGLLTAFGGTFVARNLSVDMQRQPYTLGTVISANASGTTLLVRSTQRYPPPPSADPKEYENRAQSVLEFDPVRERPAIKGFDLYQIPPSDPVPLAWQRPLPNGSVHIDAPPFAGVPLGAELILRHQVYSLNALTGSALTSMVVRDVTLWSMPGMGVICSSCGNVTLERLRVQKRCWEDEAPGLGGDRGAGSQCERRPMSITADGVHLTSTRGGDVRIEDSLFEGQGDDGINVPSRYWEMREISADRKSAQVWQRGAMQPMKGLPGDILRVYNRSHFNVVDGDGSGADDLRVVSATHQPCCWVNFSRPLGPSVTVWDLLIDVQGQPKSISVINSTFRANRARGALLKASNVAVQGCTFEGTSGPALQAVPDAGCMWFEGDVISRGNWSVSNAVVDECNYGAARQPADIVISSQVPRWKDGVPQSAHSVAPTTGIQHRGVTLADITFRQANGQAAFMGIGIDGLRVAGCNVRRTGGPPPRSNFLVSASSQGVSITNNTCDTAGTSHADGGCTTSPPAGAELSAAPTSWRPHRDEDWLGCFAVGGSCKP